MAQHIVYITFAFVFGACIGSFLNVVVWRLPRVEHHDGEGVLRSFLRSYRALSSPPSHCPKCEKRLKWYDNLPVIGWLKLGGRCRYCKAPISPRYPIVEAITGLIFVFYYVMFFIYQIGPCPAVATPGPLFQISRDFWMYVLLMALAASLLAASLIDAELFIIPLEIPYFIAVVGIVVHTIFDQPHLPGALNLVDSMHIPTFANALAAGGFVGLVISLILFWRQIIPLSFPRGEPILEVDRPQLEEEIRIARREGKELPPLPPVYTSKMIRAEIRKEMVFLFPPMACAILWFVLTQRVPAIGDVWNRLLQSDHVTGLLGSILGALIGAWTVWIVRILGTLGFGRVAMGLGDVHLMFGVGAVVGAGPSVVAFFLAPFFGLLHAIYGAVFRRHHELWYGPYLSLGTAAVILLYCRIVEYLGMPAIFELFARQ